MPPGVDKGGLDYPITSTYDPTGVAAFKKDIADLLTQLTALKSMGASLKASFGGLGSTVINNIGNDNLTQQFNKLTNQLNAFKGSVGNLSTAQKTLVNGNATITNTTNNITRSYAQATSAANNYSGALGRLLIRYIAFRAAIAVVRDVVSVFKEVVSEAINFNAEMENSVTSIASLLVAVGSIRNGIGGALTGYKAFTAAQEVAREQMAKLRVESLRTTATFEDLVKTLQVAVAPGLRAGLDINQVREFTVAISQAAAAVGVQQNQLAEEIRSILAGTINLRNTRIAAALGITNDDIRRAKELGTLTEFLRERFQSFNVAAAASAGNFDIIVANLKSGLSQLIGTGGKSLFDAVKQSAIDLRDAVIQVDKVTGEIRLNPQLLASVEGVSDALANGYRTMLSFISTVTGIETLEGGLGKVADAINLVADRLDAVKGPAAAFFNTFSGDSMAKAILAVKATIEESNIKNIQSQLTPTPSIWDKFDLTGLSGKPPTPARAAELTKELDESKKRLEDLQNQIAALDGGFDGAAQRARQIVVAAGDIGSAVITAHVPTQKLLDMLEKVKEEVRDAKIALGTVDNLPRPLLGLTGGAKSQFEIVRKGLQDQAKGLKDVLAAQKSLETERDAELVKLQRQRDIVDKFQFKEIEGYNALLDVGKKRIAQLDAINKTEENLARVQTQVALARSLDANADVSNLLSEKAKLETQLANQQRALGELTHTSLNLSINLQKNGGDAAKVVTAVNKTLSIQRDQVLTQEKLNDLKKEEIEIINKINERTTLKLQLAADEDAFKQKQDLIQNQVAVSQARRQLEVNRLERAGDNSFRLEGQKAGAQDTIDKLNAELQVQKNINDAKNEAFQFDIKQQEMSLRTIDAGLKNTTNAQEIAQLTSQREETERAIAAVKDDQNLSQENFRLKQDVINAQLDDANAKMQEFMFIQNQPVTAGITLAIRDLNKELPTVFEGVHKITTDFVNGLATTIGDIIVDAFDPTNKKDIRQRFSEFLRGIAAEMIQMLVKVAVVKASLSLFGGLLGGGGGFNEGGAVGFNRGGRIGPGGRGGPAHAFAQGRASGGPASFRPKGLHPSDTVPIWAAVGEWVIQARAVAKYGHDVMSNINSGFVDRDELRAVAKQKQGYVAPAVGPGFAAGGRIGPATASATSESSPGLAVAVMAPTEDAMERLLRGGKNSQFRFLQDNAAQIRALLGL